jgi:glycosyltransferase involved in cell wall biosynthesis
MQAPMKLAVLIPCYNEELTIGKVINDLRKILPQAVIYVYDNNSKDKTAEIARSLRAIVVKEKRQGKGFVMRSMFNQVDADIYLMVDGDDTYDLTNAQQMIDLVVNDEADMVVGNRLKTYTDKSFRPFHTFGNKLVKSLINILFKAKLKDIMSGYRVMNRDFVKNINIMSYGFEVETEMTIKSLKHGYVIKEIDINYGERPEGSFSKLNTFKDGFRVLKTIFIIFKDYKPLMFFSYCALFLLLISLLAAFVVVSEFIKTRYITHVPLAIFASGAMVLAIISFITGIILDSMNRRVDELYNFIKNKINS